MRSARSACPSSSACDETRARARPEPLAPGSDQPGPARVLSQGLQAFGPAVTALPYGGFAVAWHEAAFPALRTVVRELSLSMP